MKQFFRLILLPLFCFSSFSCNSNGQQSMAKVAIDKMPSRRDLGQKLRSLGKATIVYGSANAEVAKEYQKLGKAMVANSSGRLKLELKRDSDLKEQDLKEKVIILIGTRKSNQWIEKIAAQLPFEINDSTIVFDKKEYSDPSSAMVLPFYPNPLNKELPLMLATGLDDQILSEQLNDLYSEGRRMFGWSSWGYELYQEGQRVIFGSFNSDNWEMDKKVHFDFSNPPDSLPSSGHFHFVKQTELNEAQAARMSEKCEMIAERIRKFVGSEKEIPKMKFCLYRSAEEKGLMISNTDQASVNFRNNEVHVVLNDTYADNFIGKENELLIRHLLGAPLTIALERGLAIYFTENWQRKGYAYWAAKLFDSDNIAPLSEVLDNDFQNGDSRYVMGCLAGSFVEFLINDLGKDAFLSKYKDWTFSKSEIQKLEKEWHTYLKKEASKVTFEKIDSEIPYLKGFNFAHEGYQIYNGYISREATRALEKMTDIGSNTAAIVPYSYMRNPKKASYIGISDRPGSENDESIVHSARMAKQMGMTAVLKPQIWIGRGSWPGDVEMENNEEWEKWFANYYRWIRHYAMMAEIHEMEVLVIGTEFVQATLQREKDWRKMIKKIRAFYTGKITYAANWGEEFEKLAFWDELDYIGLNCYYPLSKDLNAKEKTLRSGFKKVIDKIESIQKRIKKPIIFTEIGFRSLEAPWTDPHAEPQRAFNEEHQALCYEIVFDAIQNKSWCQGILWWKFPSYLNYRGAKNTSFTPNKKKAEGVVKRYFKGVN